MLDFSRSLDQTKINYKPRHKRWQNIISILKKNSAGEKLHLGGLNATLKHSNSMSTSLFIFTSDGMWTDRQGDVREHGDFLQVQRFLVNGVDQTLTSEEGAG